MGGYHRGRRGGRDVTEDYRQLDVRQLHRAGVLQPWHFARWCWYRGGEERASVVIEAREANIRLRYSALDQGERKEYDYLVPLSWTRCNYGGERPWFLCPSCGRRVAKLYGGAVFACRRCYGLAYRVQRETEDSRAIRKADKIRRRLGWEPGIFNGSGTKPLGMHWRTYWRLRAEHDCHTAIGLEGIARTLGIVNGRLDKAKRRMR